MKKNKHFHNFKGEFSKHFWEEYYVKNLIEDELVVITYGDVCFCGYVDLKMVIKDRKEAESWKKTIENIVQKSTVTPQI